MKTQVEQIFQKNLNKYADKIGYDVEIENTHITVAPLDNVNYKKSFPRSETGYHQAIMYIIVDGV